MSYIEFKNVEKEYQMGEVSIKALIIQIFLLKKESLL